jgi:hypothetical protein
LPRLLARILKHHSQISFPCRNLLATSLSSRRRHLKPSALYVTLTVIDTHIADADVDGRTYDVSHYTKTCVDLREQGIPVRKDSSDMRCATPTADWLVSEMVSVGEDEKRDLMLRIGHHIGLLSSVARLLERAGD